MNISNISCNDLYQIVAGKSYSENHIKASEALKSHPEFKHIDNNKYDTLELSEAYKNGIDTSSIANVLKHDFISAKAGVQGLSVDEIAEHIGSIGKRIDSAYSDGIFTKEEYDKLNASLKDYTEKLTSKSENTTATLKAIRENYSLMRNGNYSSSEYCEMINSNKKVYLNNPKSNDYCKFDRNLLLSMINNIRYRFLSQ